MLTIPPEVLLSWPAPNYVNPVHRGPELWIVSAIFLSIGTVCVGFRLWQRMFVRRWVGLDDLLIVLAYFCAVGVTAAVSIGNSMYDWDRHIWDMPTAHYVSAGQVLYSARILWALASSFVRLSVLCLFYRLCNASHAPQYFRWILHCVTAKTLALLLFFFISGIVPCLPISAYWQWPPQVNAKCLNDATSMQLSAVLNTFSEFVVATLPLIATFKLNVDRRQRRSVIGLLSLGFLVAFTGCFRTFYVWKVTTTYDLTWWSGPQWICSEVEINLALICACAAPLRPLFGRVVRRINGIPVRITQVQQSLSSSRNAQITQTSTEIDAEAVAEWTSRVSRTVDLEGIANDGLGYSVTISGPMKQRSTSMRKRGLAHMTSISKRKGNIPKVAQDGKAGLEIPVQREVAVRESWHSIKDTENGVRWASYSSDGNIRFETCDAENQGLEFLGDPSVLRAKEAPVNPQADVERRGDGDSIDGFVSRPAMPWRSNPQPSDHVVHEVSNRMNMLFS